MSVLRMQNSWKISEMPLLVKEFKYQICQKGHLASASGCRLCAREEKSSRPLVETEYIYDREDDKAPQVITEEMSYSPVELAKLQKEYSHMQKESETEYVWRVPLSGAHLILIHEAEAEVSWGPGVFLIPVTSAAHGL